MPQEKIRRITASTPNNLQSPFYDPSGEAMKPVARLTVTRQRVYDKNCSDYEMFGYSTAPYTNPEKNSPVLRSVTYCYTHRHSSNLKDSTTFRIPLSFLYPI
ncbi:hypothetical protein AVEN_63866-1 [Araneus ventricosus]|uniref:Uncharacterized protein n=1 Tax=Araneus ventricosus TaxID=182803 RepID=A0A4Y2URJ5_ARAVE|nr:hypothetical protein AVEN_63866-1 [Araneus ventricosus]